ncbi:MAG: hypothetical protein H7123_04585, partial [Thermoleophilia bacterium]|nr:hypothetical protein [Thermoleophilia bacterium]
MSTSTKHPNLSPTAQVRTPSGAAAGATRTPLSVTAGATRTPLSVTAGATRTPLRPYTSEGTSGAIGTSPRRPDGIPKVQGEFAYSSDMHADGMLWGATKRSPHPHARIVSIDLTPAITMAG